MPAIKFRLADRQIDFDLARKVTKEDLYGTLKRVVVKGGCFLERGYVTATGRCVRTSAIASCRLDPEGTPVETEQVLFDGESRESMPSSFEEPAELVPVALTTLATFCTSDVYPLNGSGVIERGLYATWFSYRKSPERREALLLVKDGGAFLLVGQSRVGPFVGKMVAYELFSTEDATPDGDEEEMDFAMM